MDANLLFPSPPLGIDGVSIYEWMSHHSSSFKQPHASWCLSQTSSPCTCKLYNRSPAVPVWVKLKTREALEKPFPFEKTSWRLGKDDSVHPLESQPVPVTKKVYFGLVRYFVLIG
jgi:hypothetical protein